MTSGMVSAFVASFARAAAFFYSAPVIGDRHIPVKMRLAAAASVALVVASVRAPIEPSMLMLALPAELALGLLAGFAGRLIIAGAESGGQLIALHMGLGMANTFDPSLGEASVVMRRLILVLASLAFLYTDGLENCIRVIAVAPANGASISEALAAVIQGSGRMLEVALRVAAPCMIAGLVTQVGLALASKASPALNIFSAMLATLLMVGSLALIASAPALIGELLRIGASVADGLAEVLLP